MDVWTAVRELYDAILSHRRGSLFWQFLLPWADAHPDAVSWLADFAARDGSPVPPATPEELHLLYALGRVNETLLLRFQTGRADGTDWPGPEITLAEYTKFWERLGLTVESRNFAPFYHEIVEVETAPDADLPVLLVGTYWPCLMLGPLLFSRAGAFVTGGANVLNKDIAESSTLYWAYRRKNRPVQDLSHGWGSNSQWRTSFRRDYQLQGRFWYNVDGEPVKRDGYVSGCDLSQPPSGDDRDGLTRDERIELLTHRCFVRCAKPHDDLWPYDDIWNEAY